MKAEGIIDEPRPRSRGGGSVVVFPWLTALTVLGFAFLKVAVWVLPALVSSYKAVSAVMSPEQTAVVVFWIMAATIVLRGLYAFFMHRIKDVAFAERFSWSEPILLLLDSCPIRHSSFRESFHYSHSHDPSLVAQEYVRQARLSLDTESMEEKRCFERAAPGSSTRAQLKVAVWVLITALLMTPSFMVAAIMPVPVQIIVSAGMAAAIVRGAFYASFTVHKDVAVAERFSWMDIMYTYLLLQIRPKYLFSDPIMDMDEFWQNSAHSDRCMKRCHCLRWLKRPAPGSSSRAQLKVMAVWTVTTMLLTIVFSSKVPAIIPFPVQIIVSGGMAEAIMRGGFCAFFTVHKEDKIINADEIVAATFWHKIRSSVVASVVFSGLHLLVLFSCYLLWLPAALLGRLCRRLRHAISSRIRTIRARPGAGLGRAYDDPRDVAWSVARLVLDSGATRHAVGNIWLLYAFQAYSPPRFASLADGTTNLPILGSGLIESRDRFRIPNVDLVQGLQDVLISIPQLDRDHGLFSCFGNGICRITMADGTEVGEASLADDGSYVLRYLLVPAGAGPTQVH